MDEYAADDRALDELDFPDGEPTVEALRNLWAERDRQYAGRSLRPEQVEAIRAYRAQEARALAVGANHALAEVARWRVPA